MVTIPTVARRLEDLTAELRRSLQKSRTERLAVLMAASDELQTLRLALWELIAQGRLPAEPGLSGSWTLRK